MFDEKDAQHAIVSNEYDIARNSNDMTGEEEQQMNALSKIPILRTDSPDHTADTQRHREITQTKPKSLLSPTKNNPSTTATDFD